MTVKGYISGYDGQALTIVAPFTADHLLKKQNITECEIRLDDGRTISADQRKKIYATLRDISLYTGHEVNELKDILKADYIARSGGAWFSLSDTDMTTANIFLEHIIEFCLRHDIPCADALSTRTPDVSRYLYACLVYKKCAICGGKAELHHVDAVGAGRNRKEIMHEGMKVIALCRDHHTEFHSIGKETFEDKYHVYGIKLDKELCGIWRIKSR